ncbi:hypothetical protein K0M31_008295, partial [Melipona bicolor]
MEEEDSSGIFKWKNKTEKETGTKSSERERLPTCSLRNKFNKGKRDGRGEGRGNPEPIRVSSVGTCKQNH